MKNKSLPGSAFIAGVVFLMVFVNLKDESMFALLYAFTQLFAGIAAILLILLRLLRFMRNRGLLIYSLTGMIQQALFITDIMLLFDHRFARQTMLVFTGLNALMGICILADIYNRNKREIRELQV